ncbi:MAG: helix-turn-helix transcriptional regulator [Archangiaceae bacterium]|nr:helix-turn-helix transcriptional regulator [Archangiaceae bacterium]
MLPLDWSHRALTDAAFVTREAALASSAIGQGSLGFCVLTPQLQQPPALAQAGALVHGGPSLSDALRSFYFDVHDLPLAQRDRWVDPLGEGLVPRSNARRAPVAEHMKALGVHRSLRHCVCVGGRVVAALGHAFNRGAPPTAANRRALDRLADAFAPVLRAHVLLAESTRPAPAPRSPGAALTRRQWQIARRAALGLSNAEIAAQLHLSALTVKTVLERLYRATGTRGRVALARWVSRAEPERTDALE